jgi:hypothetical protein
MNSEMLRVVLCIVICGCVITDSHYCQMCVGENGTFDCTSPRFSKCAVIHATERIREILLFNSDVYMSCLMCRIA